jgi:hypothetical protein
LDWRGFGNDRPGRTLYRRASPLLGCRAIPSAATRFCSHVSEGHESGVVAGAAKCRERRGNHRCLMDRRLRRLVEPSAKPPRPAAQSALPVVCRDKRAELERLTEVDVADFAGGLFGDDEVSAVEGSAEDGARLTLGGDDAAPSRGRAGTTESKCVAETAEPKPGRNVFSRRRSSYSETAATCGVSPQMSRARYRRPGGACSEAVPTHFTDPESQPRVPPGRNDPPNGGRDLGCGG